MSRPMRKAVILASLIAVSSPVLLIAAETTLQIQTTKIAPGEAMSISWANISTPTSKDWIGLYSQNERDNTKFLARQYTNGGASGTLTVFAPDAGTGSGSQANQYEARIFLNDSYVASSKASFSTQGTLIVSVSQNPCSIPTGATACTTGPTISGNFTGHDGGKVFLYDPSASAYIRALFDTSLANAAAFGSTVISNVKAGTINAPTFVIRSFTYDWRRTYGTCQSDGTQSYVYHCVRNDGVQGVDGHAATNNSPEVISDCSLTSKPASGSRSCSGGTTSTADCTATTITWNDTTGGGTNCSGPAPDGTAGQDISVSNTAAGYTGSIAEQCTYVSASQAYFWRPTGNRSCTPTSAPPPPPSSGTWVRTAHDPDSISCGTWDTMPNCPVAGSACDPSGADGNGVTCKGSSPNSPYRCSTDDYGCMPN